jgi:hypothetical protein
MKLIILCTTLLLLTSCSTLGPIGTAFEFAEATQSQQEVNSHPDTIETVVTKDNGTIKVVSDSNKSIVQQPIPQPKFNPQKAVDSIPIWLIVIVIASGILTLINSIRLHYNNKKGAHHDTDRSIDDGGRSSDGRSVQIHGSSAEEQASADGNDDERPSATTRAQIGGQKIRYGKRRRSSEESR